MTYRRPEVPAQADDEVTLRYASHRSLFIGLLAALTLIGAAVGVLLFMPLGMATDSCYEGTLDWICTLSVRGQNALIFAPWMWLLAGVLAARAGAAVARRYGRTALFGIPTGIIAYVAMIPLVNFVIGYV